MNEQIETILQKVLLETVREQRRSRRWGIFFKLIFLTITLSAVLYNLYLSDGSKHNTKLRNQAHTALIDINGPILDSADVNADRITASLRNAFADKGTEGIVLRINSPGGSPVQSSYIYNEIGRLRSLHPTIKVYAVCVDICASGAYYIAAATDEIYADPASLVGSIGVLMNSFGFVGSMEKLGISRRLFTAGQHKSFLDPFSPLKTDEIEQVKILLDTIHKQFIASVRKGRGTRLKETKDTFSGLIWTGEQAKEIGLIDGFGNTNYVATNIIKAERIIDYTIWPNYFERLTSRIGVSAGDRLIKSLGLEQNFTVKSSL